MLHVRLSVGEEQYAVVVGAAVEVVVVQIAPMPGTARAVRGTCNLRGELLPVFDLALLLGVPAAAAEHVLVVEHEGARAGLLVGSVSEVESLEELTSEQGSLVDGTTFVDDELVGRLSIPRIFAEMERVAAGG